MSAQRDFHNRPPAYPLNDLEDSELRDVHLATPEEKKRLWWRNAFINMLFIASWFIFAILLSLYNKWMFSPEHFGFPYPLFVTTLHMFVQFGLSAVLRYGWPRKFRPEHRPTVRDYGALSGLRWSLTQLLLRDKKLGLDNPAATLFWLSPVMGVTLAIMSAIVDRWSTLSGSHFFDGAATTFRTCVLLLLPGILAFSMVLSEYYIILRAGVVPMSIAGIAKEVTTITASSWFFGDELTPLNITGVAITICGIALFTYHKYRKSVESEVPLDAHGKPVAFDADIPLEAGYHLASETDPLRLNDTLTDDRRSSDGDSPLFSVEDEDFEGVTEGGDPFESSGGPVSDGRPFGHSDHAHDVDRLREDGKPPDA
ncbi:hypothetical protein EWM64_g4028 [Hericium alpestre]|uniref:Sugar phosphate transporter domain-containing protein n=1 Tax=Hericium alpestre TaxID=135208 RepID=A0A4Z0A0L0_9AGAM|nr:hypothetical protein EWM64_g4028 [Hericium alpestre]